MLSGLYVVSQYDRNGFIIAPIAGDKHRQHDGCHKHKLSLPLAQFVIAVYVLVFATPRPTPFHAACPNQFACNSGMCLSKDRQCDGWNDCGDMSDEMKCSEFHTSCLQPPTPRAPHPCPPLYPSERIGFILLFFALASSLALSSRQELNTAINTALLSLLLSGNCRRPQPEASISLA